MKVYEYALEERPKELLVTISLGFVKVRGQCLYIYIKKITIVWSCEKEGGTWSAEGVDGKGNAKKKGRLED